MIYKKIIKPFLFLLDPERVHNVLTKVGEFMGSFYIGRFLLKIVYGYRGKDISKMVDGIYYKTPILLAAGFDYNGELTKVLPSLSFGGEEVGSVTAKQSDGNPKPRLSRLPHTKSILVNKGLRNDGVYKIIKRLNSKIRIKDFVIGVSIARTNEASTSSVDEGIVDYIYSLKKLVDSNTGDYYTINISCPNSFGGEAFNTPELLEKLFSEIEKVNYNKPMYVKMPISISNEVFKSLLDVLNKHNVQGVIIGNLQKDYSKIDKRDHVPEKYSGGLSGKPCEERSNELITLTRSWYKNRFTIMGCGGVFSYEDAKKKFDAGADLLQLITGMVYEGPGLIKSICKGIALQKYSK
jgi:dihydroorotate dehydrogenase subfamily 2